MGNVLAEEDSGMMGPETPIFKLFLGFHEVWLSSHCQLLEPVLICCTFLQALLGGSCCPEIICTVYTGLCLSLEAMKPVCPDHIPNGHQVKLAACLSVESDQSSRYSVPFLLL